MKTFYVTEDGKKFNDYFEAKIHEENLKNKEKHYDVDVTISMDIRLGIYAINPKQAIEKILMVCENNLKEYDVIQSYEIQEANAYKHKEAD